MAIDSVLVHCGGCNAVLAEDPHSRAEQRGPCPHCGSLSRRFDVNLSETVTLRSKLTAKARHPGQKRAFIEQTVGDDLHRKTGRWMTLHRLIDRVKNWYHEQITDPA